MSDPQDQNPMARNANDPGYYSSVNVNVDGYDPPGSTVSADSMIDDTDSAIGDTESFR